MSTTGLLAIVHPSVVEAARRIVADGQRNHEPDYDRITRVEGSVDVPPGKIRFMDLDRLKAFMEEQFDKRESFWDLIDATP